MPEFEHLEHAPIQEAMIDIRASLPPDTTVDLLKAIHKTIQAEYPTLKERKRWSGEFEFRDGDVLVNSKAPVIDGCLFLSGDGKRVVQVRLDGFSHHRLHPYDSWEALRDEARRLWGVFHDAARVIAVRRVAVRYINAIEVTMGDALSLYLRQAPQAPEGVFPSMTSFLQRLVVHDPERGVGGVITVMLPAPAPGAMKGAMILDTEVFREFPAPPIKEEIWSMLETLREYKNKVFFGTLTDECWKRYK